MEQKQIRVLYIGIGGICGSDKSLLALLEGLAGKVAPHVVFPYYMGSQKLFEQAAIPCSRVRMRRYTLPLLTNFKEFIFFVPRFILFLRYNIFVSRKLKKIIREFQPDIIHTNVAVYRMGQKAAKKTGIKHVWHLREYQDQDMGRWIVGGKNKFVRLLQNDANTYPIAITKGIADYFAVPHSHVIYNGIRKKDEIVFNPRKEKYFLYVGNIYKEKGVTELIKAFCEFAQTNDGYCLYLAGNTEGKEYINELNKIINSYPVDKHRILFLGEKSREDIDRLMALATALIAPSHHEAFGRIVPEAMFNGCLVIGNNSDGIKEQFDNGVALTGNEIGIRYNYRIEELAEKLKEVTTNGIEHYFLMIERAQQVVKDLYSVEEYCSKVYGVYCEILNPLD